MAVTESHHAASDSYRDRRREIATYFDRTAAETWARLTSEAPVSRVRATVRAGRAQMAGVLSGWLPQDLRGARVLDAGCGTGAMAATLAARGAEVVAVDLARNLVELAASRAGETLAAEEAARITWLSGDMLDDKLGAFDHIVAMDSLIHYRQRDMVDAMARLAGRARGSLVATFAPRTRLLAAMHVTGKLFPKGDRSPAIEPVAPARLARRLAEKGCTVGQQQRVSRGFYISQAIEVTA